MTWRRFAWLIVFLLIVTAIWLSVDLKGVYERINKRITSSGSESGTDAERRLTALQRELANRGEYIDNLEKRTLWQSDADLMSWLTGQANDSDVKIIGVERLPAEEILEYQRIRVKLTVTGDYGSLGSFLNKVERSPNAVKVDSFRMRRKEDAPEDVTMDLSLSYFRKLEKSS